MMRELIRRVAAEAVEAERQQIIHDALAVAEQTFQVGRALVVELGIFFDVLVAVMVLGILVYRIRENFSSMDTSKLNQLKG